MTPAELREYLHAHIPLSRAMGVGVASISVEAVVLAAPLAPNINHRDTLFGGSASAVAILAAWSLLHTRLRGEGVQRNAMDYVRPVDGDFTATATLAAPDAWPAFLRTLARHGRARIAVTATLRQGDAIAGKLDGDFVALAVRG
jgi:thioesterase domain-containing protein